MQIPGLQKKDYKVIFDEIDKDRNAYLSIHEFSLYLEGATKKREQRISELPGNILQDIDN